MDDSAVGPVSTCIFHLIGGEGGKSIFNWKHLLGVNHNEKLDGISKTVYTNIYKEIFVDHIII